jgi:hypothetical protein
VKMLSTFEDVDGRKVFSGHWYLKVTRCQKRR